MAYFRVYTDLPNEQVIKLKFEQQLDEFVRKGLTQQLVKKMINYRLLKLHHLQSAPSLNNSTLTKPGTRFYIDVDITVKEHP